MSTNGKGQDVGALVYWVRHGETTSNYVRVFSNPMKSFLTERGRGQAKLVGQRLSDIPFTKAFSSNYPRAKETLQIILENSKHSKSLQPSFDPRIREREHGDFEGKSYDLGNALRGKGIDKDHPAYPYAQFYVKGTEEPLDVIARAESFFYDLADTLASEKSDKPETILIVGHGYFTDLWMTHLGIPNEKFKVKNFTKNLTITLQNCGFHKFTLSVEGMKGGGTPILSWEFLEAQQDQHLAPLGFTSVRA